MRNIVLAGFMGTGKSTVAAELSRLTGLQTIEVDEEIERSAGMSIPEIFSRFGEERFRQLESDEIRKITRERGRVISTGGGAMMSEDNLKALKETGIIVCLTASPQTIWERTGRDSDRPLLQVEKPLERIEELLLERRKYYEEAHVMIDTEDKTPHDVACEILEATGWKN
jgi:shikimate kinase